MATSKLPGHPVRTDLGDGYVLHSATLAGAARAEQPGATRSFGESSFDAELAEAGLELDKVVVLPPPAAGTRDLATAAPTATLEVPVGDDESCILLVEDASGAVSWILPDVPRKGEGKSRALGAKASVKFTIPLDPAPAAGATRGLKDIGKKINSFLFKLVDPLLGPIIHGFARKWETKNRPTFTRTFGVDDFQVDDPNFPRITEADWRRVSQGRALLFVHGTFSTSGAFSGLSREVMAELSNRYGGRLFAFNHATLTADPRENAIAFLSDVPDGMNLEVDIVCHSRGGLVSRQIALLGESRGVRVRRIVFVGAVNAGTALADDEHMIGMIDRFTTIAKFIPQGAAKKILDALVLVVKVVGHGLLTDLEGLAAMNPRGPFLKAMNVPGGTTPEHFAIASDYEPKAGTPFLSLTRAKDAAVDKVFEDAANDLVVPRDGVFANNGAGGFPIDDGRCLKFGPADGIVHTEFFAEPRVGTQLLAWLEPGAAVARGFGATPSVDEVARILDVYRDQVLTTIASMSGGARGGDKKSQELTPEELEALRPHVVNLSEGLFKESGKYSTTEADVDAIVREHIPKWSAALPAGEPLRIALWAHGGLIGERDGLRIALKHVDWWKKNGVYPVYFVWETGLFDALRSILESVARKIPGLGARDLFDFTTDPLVQEGARALGGVHVWGAMKTNAQLASGDKGGARYTAKRLHELVSNPALIGQRPLEFHAVGHSAGSIFHSWFLPMAKEVKLPRFKTLQLLAPAITVADFDARLTREVGATGAVEKAVMYTMKKSFEEDDHCIRVYRKSLLYLIHHGLETKRRTPVLGLEISVRATPSVAALFGLNGAPNAAGRVVWSVTKNGGGNSSSASTTHGGFDDDVLTMNSVAANVLAAPNARVPYQPSAARSLDGWPVSDEWLDGVDLPRVGSPIALRPQGGVQGSLTAAPPRPAVADAFASAATVPTAAPRPKPVSSGKSGGGARRALSVGIDAYPGPNALNGCVNDTREWSNMLLAAGFETPRTLINEQATHSAIVTAMRELVVTAKRGDTLVFHYSGHGTEVPDLDGDEGVDGNRNDQAFVPVDFEDGAFLIDDDIRDLFDVLPAGVSLTVFIDCCHSGTITRMFGRNSSSDDQANARFLKRTGSWEDWMRAHERFRDRANATRATLSGSRALVTRNDIRWVNFSACQSTEKALEHNGLGDFTRLTTALLKGDLSRFTPRMLHDQIVAAFGESRLQTPQLDCPDAALNLPLFRALD